jgi:hypothetical protein
MSMLVIAGSTNVTTYFHLRLAASGLDATGLTISGVDLQYVRSGAAPAAKVDATALAATDTAHTDNFGIEIDATDQPGLYRFDWPDAAFAAGVDEVILTVKVATAFTESLRVRLVPVVRGLAGTALPAAAADAAGGLVISDAGGLDIDAKLANTNEVTVARMGALTDWINGGRLDLIIDIIAADTTTDIPATIATAQTAIDAILVDTGTTLQGELDAIQAAVITNAAGVDIAADIIALKAETVAILEDTAEIGAAGAGLTAINLPNQTMDIVGNITGNLSGSVGSVTGNVTGTIGGLTAGAVKDLFDTDSTTTYASAVAGSVVKEIADNAGGSALSEAGIAAAVWDLDATAHQTGGTFGQAIGDPGADTNTIFKAVVTDATGATVGVDVVAVKAETVSILADTVEIGAAGAGLTAVPWNAAWDAEVQSEVTDALEVTLSDSIPADGTLPTVKQALYMLTQFMLERSVSATTVTVKKADGSTTLFQLTLNDATLPTSITRSS